MPITTSKNLKADRSTAYVHGLKKFVEGLPDMGEVKVSAHHAQDMRDESFLIFECEVAE